MSGLKTEIAIIGAGPAGMAAALQLKRYGLKLRLFEKEEPGGLMRNARRIENYPGFPRGISGVQLAELFRKHLAAFDIPIIHRQVILLTPGKKERKFYLIASDDSQYSADMVVMASGTRPKEMKQFSALSPRLKKRIFFEIFPLFTEKKKKILIIGSGDAAFDYALNLSAYNDIFVFNRGNSIKALPCLKGQVNRNTKIRYFEQAMVKEIKEGSRTALVIGFQQRGTLKTLEADYLVWATGRVPQKDFYSPELAREEKKLISSGLLFPAGDVKNGKYRQISIAISDGIRTAMKIFQKQGRG